MRDGSVEVAINRIPSRVIYGDISRTLLNVMEQKHGSIFFKLR